MKAVEAVAEAAGYTLTQADVDALFQFMWFVGVSQFIVIALLALACGLLYGQILTRKWSV